MNVCFFVLDNHDHGCLCYISLLLHINSLKITKDPYSCCLWMNKTPQIGTKLIKHLASMLRLILFGLFLLCHLSIYFCHEHTSAEQSRTVQPAGPLTLTSVQFLMFKHVDQSPSKTDNNRKRKQHAQHLQQTSWSKQKTQNRTGAEITMIMR